VVSVTNEGTGAQRRVTADENGLYVAPELPVGFYTLKVEGGGFAPAAMTRVKVDIGAETHVDVTLAPQAMEAKVNVDFTSAAFGSISETPDVTAGNPRLGEGGPRVIQFGLKLLF